MDKFKDFLLSDNSTSVSSIVGDIVVLILSIVFLWKVFEKAGDKGWKAIIPFYNLYNLFKITWKTKYFWLLFVFLIILISSAFYGTLLIEANANAKILGTIVELICIGSAVGFIIIYINLLSYICYAFNKSKLFMLGLLFLNIIFMGILAFDKSKYVGPKVKQ